jgi:hypothetical protein
MSGSIKVCTVEVIVRFELGKGCTIVLDGRDRNFGDRGTKVLYEGNV